MGGGAGFKRYAKSNSMVYKRRHVARDRIARLIQMDFRVTSSGSSSTVAGRTCLFSPSCPPALARCAILRSRRGRKIRARVQVALNERRAAMRESYERSMSGFMNARGTLSLRRKNIGRCPGVTSARQWVTRSNFGYARAEVPRASCLISFHDTNVLKEKREKRATPLKERSSC